MNLEDRIKRRFLMEHPDLDHDGTADPGDLVDISKLSSVTPWQIDDLEGVVFDGHVAARIAAMEAEDTANPIAATAIVRTAWDPSVDEEALLAASHTPEENQ